MSEEDLFTPSRLQIFREVYTMLKEAKDITEARERYRALILGLVLGETQ